MFFWFTALGSAVFMFCVLWAASARNRIRAFEYEFAILFAGAALMLIVIGTAPLVFPAITALVCGC